MAETADRGQRRVEVGVVTKDKMNKTRRVEIPRLVKHARYGKYIRRRTICYVHDEKNESRVGDKDRVLAVSHGGIVDLPAIVLAEKLGAKLDGASFGYGEGVRVTYAKGAPVKIERL